MDATRQTLIQRLGRPGADRAWEEFYALYWQVILRYGAKLGLDEAAAHDVLQETMMVLMRILPTFEYDPKRGKFRNFVLTIVHRKALAAQRRAYRRREISADAVREPGDTPLLDRIAEDAPGPDDLLQQHWRESVWEEALARVRADPTIQPGTFDIFRAYVIDAMPAADVAARFDVKENAIYQIRSRMLKRLEREVRIMMEELEA